MMNSYLLSFQLAQTLHYVSMRLPQMICIQISPALWLVLLWLWVALVPRFGVSFRMEKYPWNLYWYLLVFLRSLWLFARIYCDRDPGKHFKWSAIIAGILLPLASLMALLMATGVSYRMGQTCLPNHPHSFYTFWIWLLIFAPLSFLGQSITTFYCVYAYCRSLKQENVRVRRSGDSNENIRTWRNVKKLFIFQWRNILVTIFVTIGSMYFFIVFYTQDSKLGAITNDPDNLHPVKKWIGCLDLSGGDKEECLRYVGNFTVSRQSILTSLIFASVSLS